METPPQALLTLERIPNLISKEPVRLWYEGEDRDAYKVTVRYPYEVPDFRKRMQAEGATVLAADIPFALRFIYDMDIGACTRVKGTLVEDQRTAAYTTDLVVLAEAFEPVEHFKPPLCILSFDIENSLVDDKYSKRQTHRGGRVLTISVVVRKIDGEIVKEALVDDDEEKILEGFLDAVKRHDPDVITGYNIDGYDIELSAGALDKMAGFTAGRRAGVKDVFAGLRIEQFDRGAG